MRAVGLEHRLAVGQLSPSNASAAQATAAERAAGGPATPKLRPRLLVEACRRPARPVWAAARRAGPSTHLNGLILGILDKAAGVDHNRVRLQGRATTGQLSVGGSSGWRTDKAAEGRLPALGQPAGMGGQAGGEAAATLGTAERAPGQRAPTPCLPHNGPAYSKQPAALTLCPCCRHVSSAVVLCKQGSKSSVFFLQQSPAPPARERL